MDTILSTSNFTRQRQGSLVRHGGVPCIVRGRVGPQTLALTLPDDTEMRVSLQSLRKREAARGLCLTAYKTALRKFTETYQFIYPKE